MKKLSVWLLAGALLAITLDEMRYTRKVRNDAERKRIALSQQRLFISTLRGVRKQFQLPDGSTVWLNAASQLSYPADMENGDRNVELYGEALFDVTPQPAHPFKVQVRDVAVEVLGTRFALRNYPDELVCQASVHTGAIQVVCHDRQITLYAGDAMDIALDAAPENMFSLRHQIDTSFDASWTTGTMSFTNKDLPALLHELSRAYNVSIKLEGPVTTHRFGGQISLDEPLDQVIDRIIGPFASISILKPHEQEMIIRIQG